MEQSQATSQVGASFLRLVSGEAAARLIAFGATVYLARTLGAGAYGVIVLATAVMLYLTYLTDCGVDVLGVREVAAAPESVPTFVPEILGARLLMGWSLASITTLLGLVLLPWPEGAVLAAFAFSLPVIALGTRWVQLGLERSGQASLARVITELVATGLILAFVHGPDDLTRVPIAQIAGEGVGALLLLRMLAPGIRSQPLILHPSKVASLLRVSWPLMLHSLLGLAIFNSDFIFLRAFRDAASVGLYAAAYTLISFFLNLGATYTMTLLPAITRMRSDSTGVRALYHDSMAQVLSGAIPLAVGGFLVAPSLINLVYGSGYRPAVLPLQILLWSIPVAVIRNVSQGALIAYQRQDQMLYTVAWAAGCNMLLNIALIPKWGMAGAAAATVITEAVRTVLAARYCHRLGLTMPGPLRFTRVVVAGGAMAAVVWGVGTSSLVLSISVGGVSYVTALIATGVLQFRRGSVPRFVP